MEDFHLNKNILNLSFKNFYEEIKTFDDINKIEIENNFLIFYLIEKNKIDFIKNLKELDVNIKDMNDEKTPLIFACECNNFEMVEMLVDRGVNIDDTDRHGNTSLIYSCVLKNLEISKLLLNKGANPNIENKYGTIPLLYSCILKNNFEIVALLLSKGANPNIKNINGDTPLIDCCQWNNFETLKILMEYKVEIEVDEEGNYECLNHIVNEGETKEKLREFIFEMQTCHIKKAKK